MQIHWPLVVSTVCQRVGLGMFLCVFFVNLTLGLALPMNLTALLTLVLLCVGGIASIFHLQRPQRFFNAFSNLKSHLTQEALLTPFLGLALLADGLNGFLFDAGAAGLVIDVLAALLALAFLICTGLAYQMGSRPAWNTGFVLSLFLLTALEAGSIAVLVLAFVSGGSVPLALGIAALLCFAICTCVQFAYVMRMRHVGYGVDVCASERPYRTSYAMWLVVGVGITGLGILASIALASAAIAAVALLASSLGIAAWTVFFFRGALKVKMFPMYSSDLNLDM
ncbi:MAG: DmsC/YnfH family molybdoenzyme membrane anchor subunit [Raoultibacter sp.]